VPVRRGLNESQFCSVEKAAGGRALSAGVRLRQNPAWPVLPLCLSLSGTAANPVRRKDRRASAWAGED
jgi:hypothetical protein